MFLDINATLVQHRLGDIMNNEITPEEIEQYLALKSKIEKFEQSILEEEQKINSALLTNPQYSGIVPHQLHITVITDVNQIQSDPNIAPITIEKFAQTYIIDFLDKSYKPLVDSVYNNMTMVLENSCKDIYTKNAEKDEVSI